MLRKVKEMQALTAVRFPSIFSPNGNYGIKLSVPISSQLTEMQYDETEYEKWQNYLNILHEYGVRL